MKMIKVAVFDDEGTGPSKYELHRCLDSFDEISYRLVSAEEIRSGLLDEIDVLVHPGGGGSKQGRCLGLSGRIKVRRFVSQGGCFLGICAGAYLASSDYVWSLHLIDARVHDRAHWNRGSGEVELQMTPVGQEILDTPDSSVQIHYGQGPLYMPANTPGVPEYELLAEYVTAVAKNGASEENMIGTSAIAAAPYGSGRVFCFGPHPEMTEGLDGFVQRAIHWLSKFQKS